MFYSLLLYCFTFFGERGEVPIGLSFSAGVPKKVEVILIQISLNLNMYMANKPKMIYDFRSRASG